jgi:hypothetical protein
LEIYLLISESYFSLLFLTGLQSPGWSEALEIKVTTGTIQSKTIMKSMIQRLKDKFPILTFMMDDSIDYLNLF